MSDLIVIVYRSLDAAFVAGENLAALQQEAGTEPEDIVVITGNGKDRVSVNQSIDLATGSPLGGGRWGTLIGMLFLDRRSPEASEGGLAARLYDAGLDPKFLKDVARSLDKGGAAVGMRVRMLGADRVVDRVKGLKPSPKVLRTRLSPEAEEALYDMQDQIPGQALAQLQAGGDF
ncbi:DUF1269 domain-containing protein [Tabrizicola sp.]|uniref:DUF1269 domain-containing protein n=1 Tax=Tabrizicola sp. TaxID=2005166 RepID=UPI003F2A3C73